MNFVAKTYKTIIYTDSIRTSIIKSTEGAVDIFDPYLLDEHDWFESKIINFIPNQYVEINQTVNIYCTILQPRHCRLTITVQIDNQQPQIILDQSFRDLVKHKFISFPFTFSHWAIYKFRFQLKTRDLDSINNWCPAIEDYVEEFETTIQVGHS